MNCSLGRIFFNFKRILLLLFVCCFQGRDNRWTVFYNVPQSQVPVQTGEYDFPSVKVSTMILNGKIIAAQSCLFWPKISKSLLIHRKSFPLMMGLRTFATPIGLSTGFLSRSITTGVVGRHTTNIEVVCS